jgi:hypothetical protein
MLSNLFSELPDTPIGHLTQDHLPFVREVVQKSNPKTILEIGFNAGHSSAIWLTETEASIITVDPAKVKHTWDAAELLKRKYFDRFKFLNVGSQDPELYDYLVSENYQPDLVFVDGDHSAEGCKKDLILADKLSAKFIMIDNLEDGSLYNTVIEFCKEYNHYQQVLEGEIPGFKLGLLQKI